jgi:hypothetical protein
MMDWKRFGRTRSWPNFKALSQHSPEGTEKSTKISIMVAGVRAEN